MRKLFTFFLLLIAAVIMASAASVAVEHVKTDLVPDGDDVYVITPDNPLGKKFPVVYLLNGYGGSRDSYLHLRPDLPALADRYGIIFVLPSGKDSWYWDSPVHPEMKMESFITTELVPWVDTNYPTIADAKHRAITGLSMGGHGALFLAMRHPDIFGSAGSMSGGVDIRQFPKNWKIAKWLGTYDENPENWEQHATIVQAEKLQPGQINIIFDCGNDDFFAEVNRNLHRLLLDKKIPHDYTERPGNHTQAYWANSLLYHITFFDQAFK